MTHRDHNVHLDPAEPRCGPGDWCLAGPSTCARFMATIPPGATVTDYTLPPHWMYVGAHRTPILHCAKKLPITRIGAAQPAVRPVRKHWGDEA